MFGAFKARAEAVSAEVHRFSKRAGALQFILEFLRRNGGAEASQCCFLWADCPFLNGLKKSELEMEVPGLRFDVTRELAARADVGISQVDWAMADTGGLVQDVTQVEQRLVSTLPPVHIAILQTDRILADLPTLLKKIDPDKSAYIAMIDGPSRTADIERVLTIGVHGPERLIIVAVDESGGSN